MFDSEDDRSIQVHVPDPPKKGGFMLIPFGSRQCKIHQVLHQSELGDFPSEGIPRDAEKVECRTPCPSSCETRVIPTTNISQQRVETTNQQISPGSICLKCCSWNRPSWAKQTMVSNILRLTLYAQRSLECHLLEWWPPKSCSEVSKVGWLWAHSLNGLLLYIDPKNDPIQYIRCRMFPSVSYLVLLSYGIP